MWYRVCCEKCFCKKLFTVVIPGRYSKVQDIDPDTDTLILNDYYVEFSTTKITEGLICLNCDWTGSLQDYYDLHKQHEEAAAKELEAARDSGIGPQWASHGVGTLPKDLTPLTREDAERVLREFDEKFEEMRKEQ